MGKKQIAKNKVSQPPLSYIKKHKLLSILAILILLVLGIFGWTQYTYYKSKLSYQDYEDLSKVAENVFRKLGATDIVKTGTCSYERPEVYSNPHLYCDIQLVTFMSYENDEKAVTLARSLEREINQLGKTYFYDEDFYKTPGNNEATTYIDYFKPLRKAQCRYSIATNERAKGISLDLPKKSENNLIALSAYCADKSRGEYFPVTYR